MKTIVIICDDHPGIVADVTEMVAGEGANIEEFEARSIGSLAVVKMSVGKSRHEEALRKLARSPYHAFMDDSILVQLDDEPGALAAVAKRIRDTGINMHSVRLIRRGGGKSIVAIGADRTEELLQLLHDVLIA